MYLVVFIASCTWAIVLTLLSNFMVEATISCPLTSELNWLVIQCYLTFGGLLKMHMLFPFSIIDLVEPSVQD